MEREEIRHATAFYRPDPELRRCAKIPAPSGKRQAAESGVDGVGVDETGSGLRRGADTGASHRAAGIIRAFCTSGWRTGAERAYSSDARPAAELPANNSPQQIACKTLP
jgi:hypothetical protein